MVKESIIIPKKNLAQVEEVREIENEDLQQEPKVVHVDTTMQMNSERQRSEMLPRRIAKFYKQTDLVLI